MKTQEKHQEGKPEHSIYTVDRQAVVLNKTGCLHNAEISIWFLHGLAFQDYLASTFFCYLQGVVRMHYVKSLPCIEKYHTVEPFVLPKPLSSLGFGVHTLTGKD